MGLAWFTIEGLAVYIPFTSVQISSKLAFKKDATKDDIKKAQQGATEKDFETDKKFDKEKVDKIQKELYGEDGKGPLLQKSETTQQALYNGYKKGEPWVAPGNAGSNFNENISNEASLILDKYPKSDYKQSLQKLLSYTIKRDI